MSAKEINKLLDEALDEGNMSAAGYYAGMLIEMEDREDLAAA